MFFIRTIKVRMEDTDLVAVGDKDFTIITTVAEDLAGGAGEGYGLYSWRGQRRSLRRQLRG